MSFTKEIYYRANTSTIVLRRSLSAPLGSSQLSNSFSPLALVQYIDDSIYGVDICIVLYCIVLY